MWRVRWYVTGLANSIVVFVEWTNIVAALFGQLCIQQQRLMAAALCCMPHCPREAYIRCEFQCTINAVNKQLPSRSSEPFNCAVKLVFGGI